MLVSRPNRRFSQGRHSQKCRVFRLVAAITLSAVAASVARSATPIDAKPPILATTLTISLNSIGYLPKSEKQASITGGGDSRSFCVRDAASGKDVYRGELTPFAVRDGARAQNYTADFSSLHTAGRYQLELPNGAKSAPFEIGQDIYNWPFYCAMQSMYLWRCGSAVECRFAGQKFGHAACHLQDGLLDHAGGSADAHRNGVGGWHDAGDYNKYTVNAAFTVGTMLRAWEDHSSRLTNLKLNIPELNNNTPDFLDEVRWELEWLLKMQADNGSVFHKLSALKFCGYVMPEDEKEPRYFSPWGSGATADFAAAMAQAARVYRFADAAFSDRCLTAAEKSYKFLQSQSDVHPPDLSAFSTGGYQSDDADDRLWAAAELWETTGNTSYLADFETRLLQFSKSPQRSGHLIEEHWDWSHVRNLSLFTYVLSKRPGRNDSLVENVRRPLLTSAARINDTGGVHSYRRPLGDLYYWGCNGMIARQSMNLNSAIRVNNSTQNESVNQSAMGSPYRATMLDGLNYLFGRNPFGRSFVTGVGYNPPENPHDRRSVADSVRMPWPGYLVGGPWPKATDWYDHQDDFKTNEIAINWNGALIYALAAFVEPTTFDECVAKGERAAKNAAAASESAQPPAAGK
jgi:endoglucanase